MIKELTNVAKIELFDDLVAYLIESSFAFKVAVSAIDEASPHAPDSDRESRIYRLKESLDSAKVLLSKVCPLFLSGRSPLLYIVMEKKEKISLRN
jgi:uncharacterized protein YcsI (UPF0317 family)